MGRKPVDGSEPSVAAPIEPDRRRTPIPPFHLSPLRAAGVGAVGLLGAGVGAAFVGGFGAALLRETNVGPGAWRALQVATGVAALAGAIAGGWMQYGLLKSNWPTHAGKALADQLDGTSTLDVARRVIGQFDRNGDGKLEVDNPSKVPERYEDRVAVNSNSSGDLRHMLEDVLQAEATWPGKHEAAATVEIGAMLRAADRDGNGVVTDVELATLMARHDTDRSGTLQAAELNAFNRDHPIQGHANVVQPATAYTPEGSAR